jgi:hypothetical protein
LYHFFFLSAQRSSYIHQTTEITVPGRYAQLTRISPPALLWATSVFFFSPFTCYHQ